MHVFTQPFPPAAGRGSRSFLKNTAALNSEFSNTDYLKKPKETTRPIYLPVTGDDNMSIHTSF